MKLLLIVFAIAAISSAASDCEKVCCRNFSGSWDTTFDDCRGEKAGYDQCVSDCTARVIASGPQGPGPAGPENTYNCKVGFILVSLLGVGILHEKMID